MTINTQSIRPQHQARNAVLTAITIAVLFAAYLGGNSLWKSYSAASRATAGDCRTAQAIIDRAQHIPAGKAAQQASYRAYRAEWAKIGDGYLQANVSNYVGGAYELAAGRSIEQTPAEFTKMVDAANSHCDQTIVMPAHPPVAAH
jgi:hypothetical protein